MTTDERGWVVVPVGPGIGVLPIPGRLNQTAVDRLATATREDLVPDCVRAARLAIGRFGGTAKTTGAGGGDVAVAVIPATADVTAATRSLIEVGCKLLQLSVDETGVDLRPDAS